jgi:hypothetical protein
MSNELEKPTRPIPYNLRLRSLKSSRQSLTRIIRSWGSGEVSTADAKNAAWLLQVLLSYHKESELVEVMDRLTKLEKALKELEEGKNREKRSLSIAR